jgi:hypothetical protein
VTRCLKRRPISITLRGAIRQKTANFILVAVRTWNVTYIKRTNNYWTQSFTHINLSYTYILIFYILLHPRVSFLIITGFFIFFFVVVFLVVLLPLSVNSSAFTLILFIFLLNHFGSPSCCFSYAFPILVCISFSSSSSPFSTSSSSSTSYFPLLLLDLLIFVSFNSRKFLNFF